MGTHTDSLFDYRSHFNTWAQNMQDEHNKNPNLLIFRAICKDKVPV